jgi:hypothetical protein
MSFKAGEGGALKLCKDCRHYRFTFWMRLSGSEPECERTRKDFVHPVSGRVDIYRSSCGYQRGRVPFLADPPDPKSICGREAIYFEHKNGPPKRNPPPLAHNQNPPPPVGAKKPPPPPPPRVVRGGHIPPKPVPPSPHWIWSITPVKPKPKRTRRKK